MSDQPNMKPPLPAALLNRCRELRSESTDAEKRIWSLLRGRQLGGIKFRRQHPIGPYILDFYCVAKKLAIELDGGQHNEPEHREYDMDRTRNIEAEGIRVLRFWNNDVLKDTERVLEAIWEELTVE